MRKILRMFFVLLLMLAFFLIMSFRSGDRRERGSVAGSGSAMGDISQYGITHTEDAEQPEEEGQAMEAEKDMRTAVSVENIETFRVSREQIRISWPDSQDSLVREYIVMRQDFPGRNPGGGWQVVERVQSRGESTGEAYTVTDQLETREPGQYAYRVDVEVADEAMYTAASGREILASNVKICIDPGHYAGVNAIEGPDAYGYAEGDFTLKIARELDRLLKEEYGVDSCMTRESKSITLGGYTDVELDSRHIVLRGEYAAREDCDLFLSIHTNANEEGANGYDTSMQPVSINKSLLIVNETARKSDLVLEICNGVGTNLSLVNYRMGLSTGSRFDTAARGSIRQWTKEYNDSLDTPGTVVYRKGNSGDDYYGVLRGAASTGTPGVIIEHGLHTIPEVRKAAQEDLAVKWAEADAYGIAYGLGFVQEITMPDREISETGE